MLDRFRFALPTGVASMVMLAASNLPAQADTQPTSILQFDPDTHCGIVLASRQSTKEITELLSTDEISPVPTMQLYRSENDWYALLWDAVPIDQSEATIAALKADGQIPEDAFCSSGKSYRHYFPQDQYMPDDVLASFASAQPDSQSVLRFDPATECGLVLGSHNSIEEVTRYLAEEYPAVSTMQLYRADNGWYALLHSVVLDIDKASALMKGKATGSLRPDSFCTEGSKYVDFIPQADYFPASAQDLILVSAIVEDETKNRIDTDTQTGAMSTTLADINADINTQPALLPLTDPAPVKAVIAWARGIGLPTSVVPTTPEVLFAIDYLDLQDLQISGLPDEIGKLANLKQLNLYGNQLTALPESIGELTNLTILDVGNNALIGLPEQIGELTALTRLNLNDNQLIALPQSIENLSNLQYLALANNELWEIPGTLQSLTELRGLYMAGNPIEQVPAWVTTMPKLIDFIP